MSDDGVYVVTTVADNGVRHAWGPFPSQSKARSYAMTIKRRCTRDHPGRAIEIHSHRVLHPSSGGYAEWPAARSSIEYVNGAGSGI